MNLEAWVNSIKGVNVNMTYLKEYIPGFRGVHALKNIFTGRRIMFMPLSTLITADIMFNTAVGRRMMQKDNIRKAEKIFLYYYLMQERKKCAEGRANFSPCGTYI